MIWRGIIWACLSLLITTATVSAAEIDGFRDFKWGSDAKAMQSTDPDLVEGHMGVMPGVKAYQRRGEDLDYGGIKADSITYAFYKGKLTSVSIDFRGFDNYEKLLVYCKKLFGQPTATVVLKQEQYAGFDSPNTGAMLLYQLSMQTTNYGRLYLYSKEYLK